MPRTDVVIVGGGVVGLSTGYYLARRGIRVTVVERDEFGRGCSYGNAGLIVPSYSMPVGTPQALLASLKWLFGGDGPFTLRVRPDPALAAWLLRFVLACRPAQVRGATDVLYRLGQASMRCYEEFASEWDSFHFARRGWLYVYTTEAGLTDAIDRARTLRRTGINAVVLDPVEVRELEPALVHDLAGGVYYPDDAHLDPYLFVRCLMRLAAERDVRLLSQTRVVGFECGDGQVKRVVTETESISADIVVVAAGAWSAPLVAPYLGRLPVQPAKGYSLTYTGLDGRLHQPLRLGESHVVATPMGDTLRMTTGLELVGFDSSVNARQVATIERAGSRYLPHLCTAEPEVWYGYRPQTPDSLPLIGPTRRYPNLLLATGHGQLGVTLGPVTGKLIAEYVDGVDPSIDLTPLLPSRFGM